MLHLIGLLLRIYYWAAFAIGVLVVVVCLAMVDWRGEWIKFLNALGHDLSRLSAYLRQVK